MASDKARLALLLSPKDDEKEEGEEGMGDLHAIAKDLISAVKEGDASAVADALRAAFNHCGSEEE